MSVLNLIRPELRNTPIYNHGEEGKYRMHANELPWSPIERSSYNCYPSNEQQNELKQQLAEYYDIEKNELTLTRGSDDGIDLLTRLFLVAGKDAFLYCPPTFSMYAFYVRLQQAELLECPLNQDSFTLSLKQIHKNWRPNCKLIMLCNPNNPTGTLVDLKFIASLCTHYRNRSVIVVDEAYIEFTERQSATILIKQFDNLVILRTLSKAFGLAGIRLGAVISQAAIINALNQIMAPYTIPSSTISIAQQALRNKQWFIMALQKIKKEREKLLFELGRITWIEKIYPSETNFLLLKTTYAQTLAEYLATNNITIRQFSANSLLHQHLRITIGSAEQNSHLIKAMTSFNELTVRI
ncbi:histidinol-phosphate transaminase [Legionella sp. km772]|uniref:histidinol-phosphate transaminase n=1 Tax=Legionella sp. km772 TaxID=2498111 RepID=UPI000F8CD6F2|nr:histidinol-phosphate transaminase [Legionella sp. km772]RUR12380.1 histidinol-phosphate transaminase [Legionella sp. km772]